MKQKIAALGALLLLAALPLFAQNATDDDFFGGLHKKGSQMITLNAGADIPLFILTDTFVAEKTNLGVGASFTLGYQYFIADRLTIGGSLCGAFNGTIGGRTLFVAPIAFKLGYWWGRTTMEYNVGADLGLSILRLSGDGVISPFTKIGGGAYAQVSEVWSLGGQAYWWLIPEIHLGSNSDLTRYGNFLEVSLSALYHF